MTEAVGQKGVPLVFAISQHRYSTVALIIGLISIAVVLLLYSIGAVVAKEGERRLMLGEFIGRLAIAHSRVTLFVNVGLGTIR